MTLQSAAQCCLSCMPRTLLTQLPSLVHSNHISAPCKDNHHLSNIFLYKLFHKQLRKIVVALLGQLSQ